MRLKPRWSLFPISSIREARPLRIVADAAIATRNLGEGRLIPLIIFDAIDRPDVEELIRVHQHLSPGDVTCQWGELKDSKGSIALMLTFKRPIEITSILEFDIVKQGTIVDQILSVKGLYLQAGKEGDRVVTNPHAPKILVEIPDTGFRESWNELFHRHIMDSMRKRGLRRKQAKEAANAYIKELRQFGQLQMSRK